MNKKVILRVVAIVLILTCNLFVFESVAFAVQNNPASLTIDDITIYPQFGIVENESAPMEAFLSPESAYESLVEWSSSDPSVVSCTENGVIKGVSSGGYAYITCKAKYGSAEDTIKVYCTKSIGSYQTNEFNSLITLIYAQPSTGKISAIFFNVNYLFDFLKKLLMLSETNGIFSPVSASLNAYSTDAQRAGGTSCEVRGKYGSYAYVVVGTPSGGADGFVKYTKLKKDVKGFLSLSASDINVWGDNIVYPDKKLTTSYKGTVEWIVGDETIIEFDKSTGQITGLKPGTTKITAKADGVTRTCTVHSLYKWPQSWIGKANQTTSLYKVEGSEYKSIKTVKEGTDFVVHGDDATDNGWAYGNIDGTDEWGYIPISSISTKGTISQYRNLGWSWPVETPEGKNKANFISSPYGERDKDPTMHKGIDITTGVTGEIKGYDVVAAFSGEVIYVSEREESSTGYCVGIRSNKPDPISQKYFVAFYMHLNEIPYVEYGQKVLQGKLLGSVGNSGKSSNGYHLHFEVNNQNASIGDGSTARNFYAYLINPLFFFTDSTNNYIIGVESDKRKEGNENKIIIDKNCSTVLNHFGAYWYGEDKKEE